MSIIEVPTMTNLDVAFGNIDHLPRYDDIPDEFKSDSNKYTKVAHEWFFNGMPNGLPCIAKKGISFKKANAALMAILVSFEPSHEHKMAGVGYLMSEWHQDF